MDATYPIQVTEQGGVLRVEWDNRKIKKERAAFWFLILFWSAWAPVTLWGTASLLVNFRLSFGVFWCLLAWLVMLMIPYILLGRLWREWVEVSSTAVTLGSQGVLAPRPRTYPIGSIQEIALGWYHDGNRYEAMTTLQVIRHGWTVRRRVLFGYWLAPDLKEQVFDTIEAFAEANNIPVRMVVYGEP